MARSYLKQSEEGLKHAEEALEGAGKAHEACKRLFGELER